MRHITAHIERLEKQLLEVQKEVDTLRKQLNEGKEEDNWPQKGDIFFFIAACGDIEKEDWANFSFDVGRKEMHNIFRTEAEAEHYRDWLKNPVTNARYQLQKFADEYNNGWKYDYEEYNWHISLNVYKDKLEYVSSSYNKSMSIYFRDVEGCKKAIEVLGEELIKTACGEIA